jgi:hypothetical protein
MLSKKFALGFGIAIALPLLIYYGVSTFSPPPKWQDYQPKGTFVREEQERLAQQYHVQAQRFARHLFFVATPLGIAAIIFGAVTAVEAIGTGLMFGGIFTVIEGYFWYWSELPPWMRFLSLLVAFGILIFIGYRQFARQDRK